MEFHKVKFNIRVLKLLMQLVLFTSLFMVFYFYYFTEIIQKFANDYTNVVVSHETHLDGGKPPILTICMNPGAKEEILKKYNISASALNEPSFNERKILNDSDKTIEAVFREATYKLNQDFLVYLSLWLYTENGWESRKGKLVEGNSNFIKVR